MQDVILSPTDFVALLNQTLEFAYPVVAIEGELANFRVAKNRWVYFDLKDEVSSVSFFGTVYNLPGPLEDGLSLRVTGSPRLHQRFGFSINVQTITPVGEGSLKKAADLLKAKLLAEGLFAPERKRSLPQYPSRIALITAGASAAYADFIKVLAERWGGVELDFIDVYVQGDQAPSQLVQAIELANQLPRLPEVVVVTRGGGSADDLAAFNDERVVRALAASRIPTLVAIGHEVDESLAELTADVRASTPTNAAQLLVPDRKHELHNLKLSKSQILNDINTAITTQAESSKRGGEYLTSQVFRLLEVENERLKSMQRLAKLFNPDAALKRGYAIVRKLDKLVIKTSQVKSGDQLDIQLSDGNIKAVVKG